jgi:glycosyltransferase involved in cell wall biosynthesis
MLPVAIIIPCFNAERTIEATLNTAVEQSVKEIVVIDDGSSDSTASIARSFSPRIRLISGPNRGVSFARNVGIAETSAEWLLFLDADDLLTRDTVERRLVDADCQRSEVIVSDWVDFVDNGPDNCAVGSVRQIDWKALKDDAELAIASHVWATTAALLYRRSIVRKIGGFRADLPIIQDARFMFDAAFSGARFSYARHVGAHYRVHPSSLSNRSMRDFYADVFRNGKQIEALWRSGRTLTERRVEVLGNIYDVVARAFLSEADERFYEAVDCHTRIGTQDSRFMRIARPTSRILGLSGTRLLYSAFRHRS